MDHTNLQPTPELWKNLHNSYDRESVRETVNLGINYSWCQVQLALELMTHSSVLLSDEQGIQIIGLSPRAMRARIINQVASHHHQHHGAVPPTTSLCSSTTTDPKPSMSDLNEIIYAVQQPDGEKVTFMIHHHLHWLDIGKQWLCNMEEIFYFSY